MSSQLLQTQSNTLLLVVEVENNDIQLLIELYNLFGVRNTSPRQVGDVNQTVYAPRAMNTPKEVIVLTVPSNTLPFSRLEVISFFCFSSSASMNALFDTNTFLNSGF